MKVVNITYWYPSRKNPFAALFIKEHMDALNLFCDNRVIHINSSRETDSFYELEREKISDFEESITISSKWLKFYRIEEFLVWRTLKKLFEEENYFESYNLINFYIAPPLLNKFWKIRDKVSKKIVVTEQYSGYHFFFGQPKDTNKLDAIKNIFYQPINLITVSHALGKDIQNFSGNKNLTFDVVPNIVRSEIFYHKPELKAENLSFFMVANWGGDIKNPFVVIEAFSKILSKHPQAELFIGGRGDMLPRMKSLVSSLDIENNVTFLGSLDKQTIAQYMNKAHFFLHASRYETFSVVTAEAICCGTPVVVSKIPAITEFIYESNGVFVEEDTAEEWSKKIQEAIAKLNKFDNKSISEKAIAKFSKEQVGQRYFEVLEKIKSDQ